MPGLFASKEAVAALGSWRVASSDPLSNVQLRVAIEAGGAVHDGVPSSETTPLMATCEAEGTIQAFTVAAAETALAASSIPAPHVVLVQ